MEVDFTHPEELEAEPRAHAGPIMVMPYTDRAMAQRACAQISGRAGANGLLLAVHDSMEVGFVTVVNRAFRATTSPWFGYLAQDAFAGRDWLAIALRALHRKRASLLAFSDGKWNGALAAFGLAEREWAADNYGGDFFESGYRRHFADAELTLLAMQQRRFTHDPTSLLIEVDWFKDHAVVDELDSARFATRTVDEFDGRVNDPGLLKLFA